MTKQRKFRHKALGSVDDDFYFAEKYLEKVDNKPVPDMIEKEKVWILFSRITPRQLARICRALIKYLEKDKSDRK